VVYAPQKMSMQLSTFHKTANEPNLQGKSDVEKSKRQKNYGVTFHLFNFPTASTGK